MTLCPFKDGVGGAEDKFRVNLLTKSTDVSGYFDIDLFRFLGVLLAKIDLGMRGRMDDGIGLNHVK